MLKRTLYFSTPAYLHIRERQLVYEPQSGEYGKTLFPVEDLGFVVIDNRQITFSMSVMEELIDNNVAVVFCDAKHHPKSLLLNLDGHHLQTELFGAQLDASVPLKKNLWKQTVEAKIGNQMRLLKKLGKEHGEMEIYRDSVKSGDTTNREAVAARYYWQRLFDNGTFRREREGEFPNNALNYGYALIRAAVARSLTGSGLLPTIGIHHCNRYNAFCLADDIMEPFRPYVDECVYRIAGTSPDAKELTMEIKKELLGLLAIDTVYPSMKSPLMVGLSRTTASLARCFSGEERLVIYPVLE